MKYIVGLLMLFASSAAMAQKSAIDQMITDSIPIQTNRQITPLRLQSTLRAINNINIDSIKAAQITTSLLKYPTAFNFNSSTGIASIPILNGSTVSGSLDGRFLKLSDSSAMLANYQTAINANTAAIAGKANISHTHTADQITDGSTNKVYTATEKTKLAGIATGATNISNTNQLTNGAGFLISSDITGKADLNSPQFGGTPRISTDTIATKAYARSVGGTGGAGSATTSASDLTSGTLNDARLTTNVTLNNATQTFTGVKTFSVAPVIGSITNTGMLTLPTTSGTLALTSQLTNGTVISFTAGDLSPIFTTTESSATTTPTLTFSANTQLANTVLAGPTTGTAAPTFRVLTATDVPSLAQKIGTTDIEITDTTKGYILKSPNGTRWRITISNTGNLITTAL